MPNYQNGKIYKIESLQTDKIYIGSTTQKLCQRLAKHREDFKRKSFYLTAYEILEYEDANIVLIENCPCDSKEELHAREAFWIKEMKDVCVNKFIPCRTKKEWRKDNAEKIKQDRQKYKANGSKALSDKIYREKHMEQIKANKARYYQENKHLWENKSKQTIHCDACDQDISLPKFKRHTQTKKHQNNLKS